MDFKKTLVLVGTFTILNFANALPDSAGIVEMTNGLAYGGIPYGSVSGMVANYGKSKPREISNYARSNVQLGPELIVSQNSRRSVATSLHGTTPVQIFSHPGVVAPGIVGMIHQVGYQ